MTPTLLMIRGAPGSGKITVARLLAERLSWPLFWLHDLDPIWRIVGKHDDSRLIDAVTSPILERMLFDNDHLIYVRPSRELASVKTVQQLTAGMRQRFIVVRLTASFYNLSARVQERGQNPNCSPFRISTQIKLRGYIDQRQEASFPGEHVINTDRRTPEQVANLILWILEQA